MGSCQRWGLPRLRDSDGPVESRRTLSGVTIQLTAAACANDTHNRRWISCLFSGDSHDESSASRCVMLF
jgi:hypothetical protein